MTKYIPNTITLINLLSGCMAIICACHPLEEYYAVPAYQYAFAFIVLASTADFLDGLSARLLGKYSPVGKQLDSLSDLVSFGVAPAILLYNMLHTAGTPYWVCLLCLCIPVCGALRLARFNIDTGQTHFFHGLPIPSAALFCVGLASMLDSSKGVSLYAAAGCIVAISLLMLAPVRMYSFKLTSIRSKEVLLPISLVLVGIISICSLGWQGLFYTVAYYAVSAFISNLFIQTQEN